MTECQKRKPDARRIARRPEFHYTPKYGSRLNMAEIGLSVFSKQCLKGRIGDEQMLMRQIEALDRERNQAGTTIDLRFIYQEARVKLNRVYPDPKL